MVYNPSGLLFLGLIDRIEVVSVPFVSTNLCATRRWILNHLQDRIARGRKHPMGKPFLSDNYGPVSDETFQDALEVEGSMPAELNGIYLRNGPNPAFKPIAGYHWFDGDGMLHACRIKVRCFIVFQMTVTLVCKIILLQSKA